MSIGVFPFIFFLLALPGIIFRRFYYQGEFSKQFQPKQIVISVFYAFIIGILIIYLSTLSYNQFIAVWNSWNPITSEKVKSILTECYTTKTSPINLISLLFDYKFMKKLTILSTVIVSLSWLLATICYKTVRLLRLDIRWKSLSFDNYWYYYFRGEFFKFRSFQKKHIKSDIVFVDLLVNLGDGTTKLYSGIVREYYLDKSGKLSSIHLSNHYTYKENTVKVIPGDCFVIPFDKVININIEISHRKIEGNEEKKKENRRRILTFLSKHMGKLTLLLFVLPYFLPYSYFENNFKFGFLALFFISILLMMLPPMVKDVLDVKSKKRDVIITYFVLCLFFFGLLSVNSMGTFHFLG